MTIDKLIEIAENLDWTVNLSEQDNRNGGIDNIASFYKYSPAGEDFGFDVFYDDVKSLIEKIAEYAYNFDVDEHIEMWVEAKNNGVSGVPSIREIVKDADAIDEMLNDLADALKV